MLMKKKNNKKKGFVRYFKKTYKQSRVYLLRLLLSAILSIVITVLANLLEVKELTYLNAFLAIGYFSNMIAFGFSNGMNIFVNQNISSKEKVEKYSKIGFELTFAFSLVFTAFLIAFPKFFMETIGGYVPEDYTFYYVMCGYFFLNCLFNYMTDILKELKLMKMNLFATISPLVITIVGFLVIYFAGVYWLTLIAIIYLISTAFGLVYSYIAFLKNNIVKINFLKFDFSKLNLRQWLIIINNFLSELIWEVGYYATSVFLLRTSDAIFNTYSYLEYILDIFNCFLFAFITITSIKISRALGQNQFQEAYRHAKYSIYATLVIWAFYFIGSIILIYPVALGANSEYFDLMFLAIPCYSLIHLFRFITWNFSSYMLRLGGKNTLVLSTEIFSTIFLVTICFITKFLPVNIFLAYFLIVLPDIIVLPIYCIYFKSKKWLANINDDPKSLSNTIKTFIFDFDDTISYNVDWSDYVRHINDFFNEHFSYLNEEERKELLKKYLHKTKLDDDYELIKILMDKEGTAQAWLDYRDSWTELDEGEKNAKHIPNEELNKFVEQAKRLGGRLYIVSNSRIKEIKRFADYHNVDLSIFDDIYINEFKQTKEGKGLYYKKIMEEDELSPKEVMVIGNSYKSDILPAKKLKMKYYKCYEGFTYEEIVG